MPYYDQIIVGNLYAAYYKMSAELSSISQKHPSTRENNSRLNATWGLPEIKDQEPFLVLEKYKTIKKQRIWIKIVQENNIGWIELSTGGMRIEPWELKIPTSESE